MGGCPSTCLDEESGSEECGEEDVGGPVCTGACNDLSHGEESVVVRSVVRENLPAAARSVLWGLRGFRWGPAGCLP